MGRRGDSRGILIVEDQGIVAKDIEQTLVHLGYPVAGIVASGEDAIQKSDELHPDLVLMDIHLAGQLDGVQAARVIHQQLKVPIIYLTAYSDPETVRRATSTAPFAFLVKPFEETELRCILDVVLHRANAETVVADSIAGGGSY